MLYVAYLILLLELVAIILVALYLYGLLRARLVPYVRTPQAVIEELIRRVPLREGSVFVELGCGDGVVIGQVKEKFPEVEARGYELALHPYLRARWRSRSVHFDVIRRSFMRADLRDADVVFCYLMPHFMPAVWQKLNRECKDGATFFSYAFPVPDVEPDQVFTFGEQQVKGKLYSYKIKK